MTVAVEYTVVAVCSVVVPCGMGTGVAAGLLAVHRAASPHDAERVAMRLREAVPAQGGDVGVTYIVVPTPAAAPVVTVEIGDGG